ncbi:MAG TPA: ribosome small subunit-dependent GTPase A [Acidimicrobiales bacterium]|nr:ribosome small subunit-dependent GTPase A [Acidimicrobiales bacterium]
MNPVLQRLGLTDLDNLDEAAGMNVGRVVISHGASADVVWVGDDDLEVDARCEFEANLDLIPVAGDWVGVRGDRIAKVLPRRSELRRPHPNGRDVQILAANVDLVLIVVPIDLALNVRLLERLSIMAWDSGARPLVVVTKVDGVRDASPFETDIEAELPGVDVLMTSATNGLGINALGAHLGPGVTAVMLGASGAGKTSLLNALEGSSVLTRSVGRSGEGRHATTTRKLYRLRAGGVLLDIPGIRLLDVMLDEEGLSQMFEDVDDLTEQCRFRNCRHRGDDGCAVEAAVVSGNLSSQRLETWRRMRLELAHHERLRDPAAAAAQRKLGKDAARGARDKP